MQKRYITTTNFKCNLLSARTLFFTKSQSCQSHVAGFYLRNNIYGCRCVNSVTQKFFSVANSRVLDGHAHPPHSHVSELSKWFNEINSTTSERWLYFLQSRMDTTKKCITYEANSDLQFRCYYCDGRDAFTALPSKRPMTRTSTCVSAG